jgi:pyridinium-3,5-biscarboxylic acid mononucleotide synthase
MSPVDDVTLRAFIDDVRAGVTSPDEAVARLRRLPFAEVGDALVDHHRALRQGMPEAVYGRGKSPEQCVDIVGELLAHGSGPVLVTRVDDAQRTALLAAFGAAHAEGGCLLWRAPDPIDLPDVDDVDERDERATAGPAAVRPILVATAGTADVPVADEAAVTLRALGLPVDRLHDVGVAGLHRLLAHLDRVTAARAVIVVAGMEGALASVIGGLTAAPVVAVPTSVGYGAGLDGVTALLAMHASCASGVSVVGIDNGFGAACAVGRMVAGGAMR